MNKKVILGALAVAAALVVCSFRPSNSQSVDPLQVIGDIPTIQKFLMDPVPDADLQRIVNAGINAPSGMNRQPWHFTVISGESAMKELAEAQKTNMQFPPMGGPGMPPAGGPGMPPGGPGFAPDGNMPPPPSGRGPKSGLGDSPAIIFISCTPGSEFDAGLACESMNDMANVLGYGTKILGSVTMMFRGDSKAELHAKLGVPEGQEVVAAIMVGKVDTADYDAVSSASPRNPIDQVVTFIK